MNFEMTINNLNYKEREQLLESFEVINERKFADDTYQLTLNITAEDFSEIADIILDREYAELDLSSLAEGNLEIYLEEE